MFSLLVLKNTFFCTNKHEHKQQSAALIAKKFGLGFKSIAISPGFNFNLWPKTSLPIKT
jgi:hypothetical protein